MKKTFLVMMFAVMTAICAQAQMFVGGSMGIDFGATKQTLGSTTNNGPATSAFELSPKVGYYLSDNFAVGLNATLAFASQNNRADNPTKQKGTEWGFAPFARLSLLNIGNFSILLEGGVGIFGSSSKTTTGSTTLDGPSVFGFGMGVMPLLSYTLTNRINLEASTNLARLALVSETEKTGSGTTESKVSDTSFGLGVDSSDFFSTPFKIGIIFKL